MQITEIDHATRGGGITRVLRPYQLRTVRIGVITTWLVIGTMVIYPFLPGSPELPRLPYFLLVLAGAAAVTVVTALPWAWLFDRGVGQWVLYAWSAVDIVLISLAITITGHEQSEMFFLFAPVMVFFAASYPIRGQVVLTSVIIISYVFALLTGPSLQFGNLVFRVSGLTSLLFLSSFLSRELSRQMWSHQRARAEAEWRASRDELTGLANRSLLGERLDSATSAERKQITAALLIDLDHFKTYNDLFGHAFGDLLIRESAHRLAEVVDGRGEVGRLGGDEFVVIVSDGASEDWIRGLAEDILQVLVQPYEVDGLTVALSASIGVALSPPGLGSSDVLRHADMALYAAKEQGRGQWTFFTKEMELALRERHTLERELRHAIETRQFEMHFQPIVELATGRLAGLEALIRWRHPERGLLAPRHFVPQAEALNLIVPLGRLALEESCRQMGEWRRRGVIPDDLTLSVNVATAQLLDIRFPDELAQVLASCGLPASSLKLEVTETVLAHHPSTIVACLGRVREMGTAIALDDFGTGYSSLGYLGMFPVDLIKIDQSFVSRLGTDGDAYVLVKGIIDLAADLRIPVVAEGIEEESQHDLLLAIDCEQGQGYLFGRPAPASDTEVLMRSWWRDASRSSFTGQKAG